MSTLSSWQEVKVIPLLFQCIPPPPLKKTLTTMPKTTRTSANNKQNNKKTKEYFYIIFGEYDRAMSANSEEKGHNNLCIDLGHDRSFLSREAALCFLYHAVATMGDDKIIHGSMRITGIQCVTKEQVAIWHEDTGILRTAGLDTTSKGKITTKF
jgi:hypothetical protein